MTTTPIPAGSRLAQQCPVCRAQPTAYAPEKGEMLEVAWYACGLGLYIKEGGYLWPDEPEIHPHDALNAALGAQEVKH